MKIKLKYDSDYAEVARDLCDIAGLKCGDFRKKFQSYLEGMVRPALPPVSAKVLAGKIAESMAEKGFHRDCGNNDRLVIANELETLEEIVLLSAASGPRHPETLEYLGKRFELAGERRAPRKGEYWLGVVADPVSDSAFGPEMPIAPDKGIAVLATFDYASWNERQILRELPPLAPVEQPVIGGSVMVDPHGHQHAKTNQCQYSGCVEASPAPDSAAWWRQVAQRLAIKVHEYEHPASVAVSAVDFYDHWIMNVHQCKGKHGIRETAIEFAEAYHLQAGEGWVLYSERPPEPIGDVKVFCYSRAIGQVPEDFDVAYYDPEHSLAPDYPWHVPSEGGWCHKARYTHWMKATPPEEPRI